MSKTQLLAVFVTALLVLGLIAYRLLCAAPGEACAAGLGHFPAHPKAWRRWLFGENASCNGSPLR